MDQQKAIQSMESQLKELQDQIDEAHRLYQTSERESSQTVQERLDELNRRLNEVRVELGGYQKGDGSGFDEFMRGIHTAFDSLRVEIAKSVDKIR